MTNLFTFAANESTAGSIYYLGSIFGTVGAVLTGTGPGLMGILFNVFNTAVLALGTIIITYSTGMSIILTAHEGEMLGKKFHSLWMPLRTVMGMSALIPNVTGYSYLQIALMWFILQGVGAADTLWTAAVNYVNAGGSTAPAPPGSQLPSGASKMQFGALFEDLVCQAAEKATGITTGGYLCTTSPPQSWCTVSDTDMLNITGPQSSGGLYKMGVSGECGTLTLGGATGTGPIQNGALQLVVSSLGSIASQFVNMDASYANFISAGATIPPPAVPTVAQNYCNDAKNNITNCIPTSFPATLAPPTTTSGNYSNVVSQLYWPYWGQTLSPNPTTDFITANANLYTGVMSNALATAAATAPSSPASTGNPEIDNGWIFAGAYFYNIAQANQHAVSTVTAPDVSGPANPATLAARARLLYNVSVALVGQVTSTTQPTSSTGPAGSLSAGMCILFYIPLGPLCNDMIDGWTQALSGGGGNPVVSAQTFGTVLLAIIGYAIPLIVALVLVEEIGGTTVLGTGNSEIAMALEFILVPILFFFAVLFMGIGATLAVYTPLVPFTLFCLGAINWMVGVIETMIAAPIIAVGLLYPEGQHELWGKAEAAINLLLNIFLRPSLIVFGMLAGMLMSYVTMTYINAGFMSTVQQVAPVMSMLEMVFFMCLYTTIFVTVINKCFELIHIIPDKILRWIGGGGEQFGSDSGQAMEKISQGFQGSAQKMESTAQAAKKGAAAAGKKIKEAKGGGGGPGTQSKTPTPPASPPPAST